MKHRILYNGVLTSEWDTDAGFFIEYGPDGRERTRRAITAEELDRLEPVAVPTVDERVASLEAENAALRAVLHRKGVATDTEVEAERVKGEKPPGKGNSGVKRVL